MGRIARLFPGGDLHPKRFRRQLDETAPSWGDGVWLRCHANDGVLLEQCREEGEELLTLPEE